MRLEVGDDVGVTVATHGWIGAEMSRGKFMLEEGAEMQWKEEREVSFLHSYFDVAPINNTRIVLGSLNFTQYNNIKKIGALTTCMYAHVVCSNMLFVFLVYGSVFTILLLEGWKQLPCILLWKIKV